MHGQGTPGGTAVFAGNSAHLTEATLGTNAGVWTKAPTPSATKVAWFVLESV